MTMYGLTDLKPAFRMTKLEVECPVKGCTSVVPRQTKADGPIGNERFLCHAHHIYISPSTFAYANPADAFLWRDDYDTTLLDEICGYKAESHRLNQERSEDALTWNVFRYFDKQPQNSSLRKFLQATASGEPKETIYWSYSTQQKSTWDLLNRAHHEFGETTSLTPHRSRRGVTEPDIMLLTSTDLILIEAKFTSGNETSGNAVDVEKRVLNEKQYVTGGDNWFSKVFAPEATYEKVVRDQKYELLRMWLLGSWIASQLDVRFTLVNLVRDGFEESIAESFGKYLVPSDARCFVRRTWEGIARECLSAPASDDDAKRLLRYLREKTAGFLETKATEIAQPVKAFNL